MESTVSVFILEILKEETAIKTNNLALVLLSNQQNISWNLTNIMKAGILLHILKT
jgi:predicted transcriptional regulator